MFRAQSSPHLPGSTSGAQQPTPGAHRLSSGGFWRTLGAGALVCASAMSWGCKEETAQLPDAAERDARTGLTPTEAREVLVRVGEREITLGQYAETLLRMDPYERLRYQSEERQKALLDEMIEVELLAQEAKRRGLDRDPQVQLRLRQALRDEVLNDLERKLPGPETFTEREVKDYYDAHKSEFVEPLRHRVQVIRLGSKTVAAAAQAELASTESATSAEKWAEVWKKYSLDRDSSGPSDLAELAGDLGFVSAPGEPRGDNERVPKEVRAAAFQLKRVGDIAAQPVQSGQDVYLVRLSGVSPARDRSMQDADRAIRVELRRQAFIAAEKKLEQELRKKYPVTISALGDQAPSAASGQPAAPGSP